ncbi:MAG: glycine cleavage system aminomethyltransferase GcvT [Rhodobacterales bacterium]|nr:glycine cleavage system aminomethyltransferase GcvT [Rhodobacterales bacterium]
MDLRTTPFTSKHVEAGARMVPFAGFSMPVQYSGLKAEHLQVRASVGLFDVSHMGEVWFRGPKAEDALMWLLSNAIRRIPTGGAQYNAMCNTEGGVVDDVFVYKVGPEEFMVCVNAANREKDFAWMIANNPHGADIVDEGDGWAQIAIQGPKGVEVADKLTNHDLASMKRHRLVMGTFAGVEGCIMARTGYTGEDGFEVFIPSVNAAPVWDAVLTAGEEFGILPIGLGARDTLRLEVGNCLYGHELTDTTTPLQAGLGWVTKLRKPGGFIGAEAIAARKDGEPRKLVKLRMTGKRIAREHMPVLFGEDVVGEVTSGTKGPSVGEGIALAYVDVAHTEPGTELVVDVRGRPATAVVHAGSFLP